MAEPTAISVILEPLTLIVTTLTSIVTSIHYAWWAKKTLLLVTFPFKVLLVPFRFLATVLLVIFAPVIHVLSYVHSCVRVVLGLVASLEPLYTFFGAAAFVGIIAGLVLGISSTYITSYLGMHTDSSNEAPMQYYPKRRHQQRYVNDTTDDLDSLRGDAEDDSASSNEIDIKWLDSSTKITPSTRRRLASGLLTQTIHEEEDDDDESDAAL